MPGVVFQQLLAKFLVAGQEEPVLWQHDAGGAALAAKLQTAVEKYGSQIILRGRIVPFTEISQFFMLLAPGQIGHVGDDPLIPSGKQGRGLCQPLGHDGDLLVLLPLLLL